MRNLAKHVLICILLLLAVCAVFGQTAQYKFVEFDDPDYVLHNRYVNGGITFRGVVWALTRSHSFNWHPITWISHMLDCRFFGLNPGRHHLVNVLLHGISACVLFTLLRRLTGRFWPSAAVAALFAIHPLRVESVAWISERKDMLSGLFFFLTLLAYESYVRRGQTVGRYLLATLFFVLGLMAKPMLVTLPLAALLLDFWPLQRHRREIPAGEEGRVPAIVPLCMEKLPWLILAAVSCFITLQAQARAISALDKLPLAVRLPNAVTSYVAYLGQAVWPTNLAILYPHSWKAPPPGVLIGALAVLAVVTSLAVGLRRTNPWLLFGWLWYLGTLVPVVGLVQVGRQAMADRYSYLPHVGLYIAVVWTIAGFVRRWPRTRAAVSLAAALGLACLSAAAWRQTAFWRDNFTLWTRAVAIAPNDAMVMNNLAGAYYDEGRIDEARAMIDRIIELHPQFAQAYYNRGRLLARDGNIPKAIEQIQQAVDLEPNSPKTQNELAMLLFMEHRQREAIACLENVLRLDSEALIVMQNLAWVLATTNPEDGGDPARAVALAERICRMLPSPGIDELDILAAAYASARRYDEAAAVAAMAAQAAAAAGRTALAEQIAARQKLYLAKKPYRS